MHRHTAGNERAVKLFQCTALLGSPALWRCIEGVPLPTTPQQCGSALKESHCSQKEGAGGTKCRDAPVVAPCGVPAGDGCPPRHGITGTGDKVSRCAGSCYLWGACGGWLSPKRRGIMGRGAKCCAVPVVATRGLPAEDGCPPKGVGSRAGGATTHRGKAGGGGRRWHTRRRRTVVAVLGDVEKGGEMFGGGFCTMPHCW